MIDDITIDILTRSFRAQALARRPDAVQHSGSGRTWLVQSQRRRDVTYTVDLSVPECTCTDYLYRQPQPCKHILAAKRAEERAEARARKPVYVVQVDLAGKVLGWQYKDPALETERQEQALAEATEPKPEKAYDEAVDDAILEWIHNADDRREIDEVVTEVARRYGR